MVQTLNPEQMVFMQQHHKMIEYASFATIFQDESLADIIVNMPEFKRLFSTTGWDWAIDTYEDTPGYSCELRITLRNLYQHDQQHSRITIPVVYKPGGRPVEALTAEEIDEHWLNYAKQRFAEEAADVAKTLQTA